MNWKGKIMKKVWLKNFMYYMIALLLTISFTLGQPIPTNEWVNYYSSNTTLDGSPIPVGAVVNAYDPDGVWCGNFIVTTQGQYGFLLVYRDDATTAGIDEGAEPGDTITFHINGHIALQLGPSDPLWTTNGDIVEIDLEGHSNYDPTIVTTADTTAIEDDLYSYTVIATDVDLDTLIYSLSSRPNWLSIDSVTGLISGTPTNDNVGDTIVTVIVNDGHSGQDTQTYTLHVLNTNDSPLLTTTSLPNAIEDIEYSEIVVASDVDIGDTLTFNLLVNPTWLNIDNYNGLLSGTPTNDDVGDNINVKIRVSDLSGASDTLDTYINVININDAPVISSFPDWIEFRSDTTVVINLNDYVEDVDHLDPTLDWTVAGNDSIQVNIDPSSHIAEISAPLTYSGSETLVFTVTDDSLASDNDTMIVNVIHYIYTVNNSLDIGWNLVSWDVDTPNDSIGVLLSGKLDSIIVVLGYESGGLTYDPDWPQFSNLLLLDHLHGYWIKTLSSIQIDMTGATIDDNTPIEMESGWNLISYLPEASDSVSHALMSIYDNIVVVLGFDGGGLTYDPVYSQFSNLQVLSPGFGYWVKLTSADTLVYPDNQLEQSQVVSRIASRTATKNNLNPTNEWISVFGEGIVLNNHPLKVDAVIQAKDPGGIICGEYVVARKGSFGMMPVYRDDPMTDIDEGAEPNDEIRLYVDGIEVDERVMWNGFGEVYRLGLKPLKSVVPMSYELSQNYPNPFNPVTQIQYQVSEAHHITMTIFNIRGQFVRTVIDEWREPGYHFVIWNGKDEFGKGVSSGVYIYQMKAGKYIRTKKMILLR